MNRKLRLMKELNDYKIIVGIKEFVDYSSPFFQRSTIAMSYWKAGKTTLIKWKNSILRKIEKIGVKKESKETGPASWADLLSNVSIICYCKIDN